MPKNKSIKKMGPINENLTNITGKEMLENIDNDIEYSLEIDPEHKYDFTEDEVRALRVYIDTKSILATSTLTNIQAEKLMSLIHSYKGQQEIRRINRSLYQRRFAHKILSLDEVAAWLSSGITDSGVTSSERFDTGQKLRAAQMLIDLQTLKSAVLENPDTILYNDIEQDVKKMSLSSIKKMIHNQSVKDQLDEKEKIINKINVDNLFTQEEITYMKTLSIQELNDMLNIANKETAIEVEEDKSD